MRRSYRRRRKGLEAPVFAPPMVDYTVDQINPVPDWLMLREYYDQDQTVEYNGVMLDIAVLGSPNTTFGIVLRVPDELKEELNIDEGSLVVYREWQGSRWVFRDGPALILNKEDVLGKVTAL